VEQETVSARHNALFDPWMMPQSFADLAPATAAHAARPQIAAAQHSNPQAG
jgi:hypothetical protein